MKIRYLIYIMSRRALRKHFGNYINSEKYVCRSTCSIITVEHVTLVWLVILFEASEFYYYDFLINNKSIF